ncbi:hypothetical protein SAMN05443575_3042 [Jatrophihabitans endophyticus]|uniref:FHA domain-containing protein n=1 Tax=Jatrophihabitans endophyticus TaxID=1206085 RepID=A0A1M5PCC6_9ACTN|nr:hypothetical protein [Jatrophihabitans endophyticus]SHG99420.1 hypothetical protein SAMN05443575_3042 [Jatrophihabitans endophyticus]
MIEKNDQPRTTPEPAVRMPVLTVEFCGELFPVAPGEPFVIGREGQLEIDDNPYLHRRFLQISDNASLWWLGNVGSALTATVADEQGSMQAWLAPGAQLPIVFDKTVVWFTAGPTTYELSILVQEPPFMQVTDPAADAAGAETIGPMTFTPDQRLLILALCESMLRDGARGAGSIPSSADAANRLGWKITKFNRKLDNVCEKLTRAGIRGLHGGPEKLAVNRRARLVEYALAARLVERADLDLLDGLADVT